MELNILRWHAVNLPFRYGDPLEDGQRVFFYEGREFTALNQFMDLPMGSPMDMLMGVRQLVFMMPMGVCHLIAMIMIILLRPLRCRAELEMRVRTFFLRWKVTMLVSVAVAVLMLTFVRVAMRMRFLVVVPPCAMKVPVLFGIVLIVGMRSTAMDPKLDALNALPLLPLEVHMKVADLHLREFPFQRGGLYAKVAKCAYHHVAADA
jgi:hypothetical protein